MKRILILAYDFPPYTSMGAQRPLAWFKYAREFNYYPVVVTRDWPDSIQQKADIHRSSSSKETAFKICENGTIISVPYRSNLRDRIILKFGLSRFVMIRKTMTLLDSLISYLLPGFHNRYSIYSSAEAYIERNKVDIVIATGEPFIMFLYASRLSKKFNIPWIADYRDCWSQNYEVNFLGGLDALMARFVYSRIEKKVVQTSSIITTPALVFKETLSELFPKKRIEVVNNGYNPDEFVIVKGIQSDPGCFRIAFAGSLYPFQPLELFTSGFRQFLKRFVHPNVKVTFFGTSYHQEQSERLTNSISEISSYFEITERLNRAELFQRLREQHVLILFDNRKMISGKLYEYLGLERCILMVGDDNGPMSSIITESKSGVVCDTESEIANFLESAYNSFLSGDNLYNSSVSKLPYHRVSTVGSLISLADMVLQSQSLHSQQYN